LCVLIETANMYAFSTTTFTVQRYNFTDNCNCNMANQLIFDYFVTVIICIPLLVGLLVYRYCKYRYEFNKALELHNAMVRRANRYMETQSTKIIELYGEINKLKEAAVHNYFYGTQASHNFAHKIHFVRCTVCLSDKYDEDFFISTCCFRTMHEACFNEWKASLKELNREPTCIHCNTKGVL
jgi:hypothetical protein